MDHVMASSYDWLAVQMYSRNVLYNFFIYVNSIMRSHVDDWMHYAGYIIPQYIFRLHQQSIANYQ